MTWAVIKTVSGSVCLEHHALVSGTDAVLSRHASYPEAAAALVAYRDRQEREELEAAGQRDLFGGDE